MCAAVTPMVRASSFGFISSFVISDFVIDPRFVIFPCRIQNRRSSVVVDLRRSINFALDRLISDSICSARPAGAFATTNSVDFQRRSVPRVALRGRARLWRECQSGRRSPALARADAMTNRTVVSAPFKIDNQIPDVARAGGIDTGGRLIQHNQFRFVDQRLRQSNALQHPF